mgnify:CR=1 FL=1
MQFDEFSDISDMELLKLKEKLTPEQNRNIERLVDEKKKKLWVAYLLLFVFGGFGAYKFYIGENTGGAIMLICTLIGIATWFFVLGIIISVIIGLIVLVDIFRLPSKIEEYNKKLEQMYIKQYLYTSSK